MDNPHILIVDDDERLRDLLTSFLRRNGFLVSQARDAAHARKILNGLSFDLIVLDVMMPGEDGISLCHHLRQTLTVPIMMLTARGETGDKISGLEAGADDYLVKPFDPKELLLRIGVILRRTQTPQTDMPRTLFLGSRRYVVDSGELWHGDTQLRLTTTEAQVMAIFAQNVGTPLSREYFVDQLGRGGDKAQERAVDVQMTRLRRKLEDDPKQPNYLQTVRGEGYVLLTD